MIETKIVNDCIESIKVYEPYSGMCAEFKGIGYNFFETKYGVKVYTKTGFTFYPWNTIRSYSGVVR